MWTSGRGNPYTACPWMELSTSTCTCERGKASNAQPETITDPVTEALGCGTSIAAMSDVVRLRVNGALCDRVPLDPLNTSEKLPIEAAGAAVKVTCAEEFAAMESGNIWDEVTLAGRPVRATETEPEKPFSAF